MVQDMENIIETIVWPGPLLRDCDYVRGHILRNPWGSWANRWVAVILGYEDNPPDAQAFHYLPDARHWAFRVLRERNRARDAKDRRQTVAKRGQ